jgi:predicted O-linked N-acetylglucosamine transferase (SPINDLY family)
VNQAQLQTLFSQAVARHQAGDLAGAEQLYRQVLQGAPTHYAVLHMLGVTLGQQGRPAEALPLIEKALSINPKGVEVWPSYANVLKGLGRLDEALSAYDKAERLNPSDIAIPINRAIALLERGRAEEALQGLDRLLRARPGVPEAWSCRGYALSQLGRQDEAVAAYDRLLSLKPNDADALSRRGIALWGLGRLNDALADFDRAVQLAPNFAEGWCNRSNALRLLGRLDEALASADRAVALNPQFAAAIDNRGIALWEMRRFDEALAAFDRALQLQPANPEFWNHRGVVLRDAGRYGEAIAAVERALALKPDFADAHYDRANLLHRLKRYEEALAGYQRALALNPRHSFAFGGVAEMALFAGDWAKVAEIRPLLEGPQAAAVSPLVLLGYGVSPEAQLAATRAFTARRARGTPAPLAGAPYNHQKLRIAYVSGDFNRHPVAYQIAELIEKHDRARFEVIGISYGADDGSPIRARLKSGFDAFHDVAALGSRAIAEKMRALEIDIAVDLNGHTLGARLDIFHHRPAPVQATWLGYPATVGADFIDYVLADATVLPEGMDAFYSEKIVRLPFTYWPGVGARVVGPAPSRKEVGLPDEGFVFSALNNHWKITAALFDVWMRLLAGTPGSLIWLKDGEETQKVHFRAAAATRGIAPERLVFAPPLDDDAAYLARHAVADLFLDTNPYNAHATASDALLAGIPVLTFAGEGFHARVAASLLNALDLPELVTGSVSEYESRALQLARDPSRLSALRARLAQNRHSQPLFDTGRATQGLEAAFLAMQERKKAGLAPAAISLG